MLIVASDVAESDCVIAANVRPIGDDAKLLGAVK
jgi:hypothetical protein